MILSIDESIQRLKAEILAQDWQLSPRRLEYLAAAFACLKNRFKNRKGMFAILAMAEGVVAFLQKRQGQAPHPGTIDFLKETMAQVVNLYEERDYDPEHEEALYQRVYVRFSALKEKLREERQGQVPPAREAGEAAEPPASEATVPAAAPVDTEPAAVAESLEPLLAKLHLLLGRQDGSTLLLHRFLEAAVGAASSGESLTEGRLQTLLAGVAAQSRSPVPTGGAPVAELVGEGGERRLKRHEVKDCPATPVRSFTIGSTRLVIPESAIAAVRTLKRGKVAAYLYSGRVPLADLSRFMQGLAEQFEGPLAEMKDRQLKKLALPLMTPHGLSLPEVPDDTAAWLMVVSLDNRHGALLCSDVAEESAVMVRFQKGKNGDIVGVAYLEEGAQAPLLDVEELLRREGFISIV